MSQVLKAENYSYQLGQLVAQSDAFDLYLCEQLETNTTCLLQVATEGKNNLISRSGYIIKEMTKYASELEVEYEVFRKSPDDLLNYQFGFPYLVETMMSPKQNRRINILDFHNVDHPSQMVPVGRMISKDQLRVDLKTSAWILGKLLKILVFTHDQKISFGGINSGKVLIEPSRHLVTLLDWSGAEIHNNIKRLPREITQMEISEAANVALSALGMSSSNNQVPDDGEDGYGRYTSLLLSLSQGSEYDAFKAHKRFYALIEELWGRKFHQFTTYTI